MRPDAGRHDPGYYLQEQHGYRVLVQYKASRLIELDDQRILEEGPSGLLPFAPLMQPPAGLAAEGWLRQCVNRAQQVPLDESRKVKQLFRAAIQVPSLEAFRPLLDQAE